MKKIVYIGISIFLVIFLGVFIIGQYQQDTEITKETTKVGMVLNGVIDDHSWGESHYNGLEKTAKECNLQVIYKEKVPEDKSSIRVMEDLIKEGCEIIICNSFGYGEYEEAVAKKHPEIDFFHATGVKERKNMATFFGRIYQMRYLSGIVAGMMTKSNVIGYLAAHDIAEVNRGINAFTLGVRSVNPKAKVYVHFSDSWVDEKVNEEAAEDLFASHSSIDIFTMHCDALTPMEIAKRHQSYIIGYNIDNTKLHPDHYLTAPIWHWEKFYSPRIMESLQGKFTGKHYWESVETGVVDLAPLNDRLVSKEVRATVAREKHRIKTGKFDVFYGPIVDNQGVLRVKEGESMTDDAMLNRFDWYVEGVVIQDEK